MNNEPNYKQLYLNLIRRREIRWAVNYLLEALDERADCEQYSILSKINQAEKYLREWRAEQSPYTKFTEEEAAMSSMVHTYFRKYDDSHIGNLIYKFVNESRGMRTWLIFIKNIIENIAINRLRYSDVDKIDEADDDDNILYTFIKAWSELDDGKNYKTLLKSIMEWNKPVDKETK